MAKQPPPGAKRHEIAIYEPDQLSTIIVDDNISRSNPDLDLELPELAKSIAKNGQLQPGLLRIDTEGRPVLVAAFRRLAAIKLINADPAAYQLGGPVPFTAKVVTCNAEEAITLNLIENRHRLDLNCMDLAHIARELKNREWTQERIAVAMDCPAAEVAGLLFFLTLPSSAQRLLAVGRMRPANARAMKDLSEATIDGLTARIAAGEKPAKVMRDAKTEKRAKGKRAGRTLSEAKLEIGALDCDQGNRLLEYFAGVVELKDVQLCDFTALKNANAQPGETQG